MGCVSFYINKFQVRHIGNKNKTLLTIYKVLKAMMLILLVTIEFNLLDILRSKLSKDQLVTGLTGCWVISREVVYLDPVI